MGAAHGDDLDIGLEALGGDGYAGGEASATDGEDDHVDIGSWSRISSMMVPLPAMNRESVESLTYSQPRSETIERIAAGSAS